MLISFPATFFGGVSQASAYATLVVDDTSSGTNAWVNPDNASGDNGDFEIYSNLQGSGTATSHYLRGQFSFSIPTNRTILGIGTDIWICRSTIVSTGSITSVRLAKAGVLTGTPIFTGSRALSTFVGVAPTQLSDFVRTEFGGIGSLGGLTFTSADINNGGVGFGIQCDLAKLSLIFALKMKMTVFYV